MTKARYKNIKMRLDDSSKEVRKIRNEFKSFKLIDYDEDYIVLVKEGLGAVEGRILRGSLGAYDYKFVVERFGERSKLFWGKDVIKRIKKYLELGSEKTVTPKSNTKKQKKSTKTKAKHKILTGMTLQKSLSKTGGQMHFKNGGSKKKTKALNTKKTKKRVKKGSDNLMTFGIKLPDVRTLEEW